MSKILLIDDDEDYSVIIRMRLQKQGYQVERAPGCDKAIELLEKDFGFDVIILDVEMPEKNGLATLAYLKGRFMNRPGGFTIPVMIATGLLSSRLRDIFAAQQVADYIQKPFEISALTERIGTILAKKG